MECRILKLPYTITKGRKHPIVPGADSKHGYVKERGRWWSVSKSKILPSDKFHPLLCYLWVEDEGETDGLFAAFAGLIFFL